MRVLVTYITWKFPPPGRLIRSFDAWLIWNTDFPWFRNGAGASKSIDNLVFKTSWFCHIRNQKFFVCLVVCLFSWFFLFVCLTKYRNSIILGQVLLARAYILLDRPGQRLKLGPTGLGLLFGEYFKSESKIKTSTIFDIKPFVCLFVCLSVCLFLMCFEKKGGQIHVGAVTSRPIMVCTTRWGSRDIAVWRCQDFRECSEIPRWGEGGLNGRGKKFWISQRGWLKISTLERGGQKSFAKLIV